MASNKNICIIASSLGGGGAERVASQQSKMFQEIGFNVFVITLHDCKISYPIVGKLLSLGFENISGYNVIDKLIGHYRIRQFLKTNKIDVIIDHRNRSSILNEYVYKFFSYFNIPVIYYVHSYVIKNYIPNNNFFAKQVFNHGKKIIAVSNEIKLKLKNEYGFKNVKTIYNFIDIFDFKVDNKESVPLDYDYVLFYGRIIDEVKNLRLLIAAYTQSVLPANKIKLKIIGDGQDRNVLIDLVENQNLSEMILFSPHTDNPFPVVKKAIFTLLTSKNEGFPMVLLESLACGTPVVSVNCMSGPSEIVTNELNGLLVENNNVKALSKAMNSFVLDKELYNKCKLNTKGSIFKFNKETIAKQWLDIL